VTLEGDDPIHQFQKVGEIVGREHLALNLENSSCLGKLTASGRVVTMG
jgi:hypothetical protein